MMKKKQAFGKKTSMEALKKQYGEHYLWNWFEETAKLNDEPLFNRHIAGPLVVMEYSGATLAK